MNNRQVSELLLEIKNGGKVPNKTIQMAIGYFECLKQKHKNNQKFVEMNEIQKIIDFLKQKK